MGLTSNIPEKFFRKALELSAVKPYQRIYKASCRMWKAHKYAHKSTFYFGQRL